MLRFDARGDDKLMFFLRRLTSTHSTPSHVTFCHFLLFSYVEGVPSTCCTLCCTLFFYVEGVPKCENLGCTLLHTLLHAFLLCWRCPTLIFHIPYFRVENYPGSPFNFERVSMNFTTIWLLMSVYKFIVLTNALYVLPRKATDLNKLFTPIVFIQLCIQLCSCFYYVIHSRRETLN